MNTAASVVLAEVTRFMGGEHVSSTLVPFVSLGQVFESVSVFTNSPTVFFVLPANSDWTVLWNNSYLCDGYDSLCWCLTTNHGLTTVHWRASDGDGVFQAGCSFTFRKPSGSGLTERTVYCCKNDKRWDFWGMGEPLPEEDAAGYSARRLRDRLNEQSMLRLLARLGARPWEDDFYRPGKAFRIESRAFADRMTQKTFADFACKRTDMQGS
jgi:hypothetical protein